MSPPPVPRRAALYGDGLFETLRVHAGGLPLLDRHLDRLARDAPRIGFRLPPRDVLAERLSDAARGHPAGALRLALYAPDGARGYARGEVEPVLDLSLHPLPSPDTVPLTVVASPVPLPAPDPLVGAKHCNRLAQVLAARALPAGVDEALQADPTGRPICALSGNLLAVIDGRLCTPSILDCGVRGVLRGWLLTQGRALGLAPIEAPLGWADLARAEELLICNALRGLRVIGELRGPGFCQRPGGAAYTRRLAAALRDHGVPVQLPELP
jgi:4-amino-4-deoxychorismate lyase